MTYALKLSVNRLTDSLPPPSLWNLLGSLPGECFIKETKLRMTYALKSAVNCLTDSFPLLRWILRAAWQTNILIVFIFIIFNHLET